MVSLIPLLVSRGITVCTEPLPKLCVPTIRARSLSFKAPATISDPEAEPALIRTTIGSPFKISPGVAIAVKFVPGRRPLYKLFFLLLLFDHYELKNLKY